MSCFQCVLCVYTSHGIYVLVVARHSDNFCDMRSGRIYHVSHQMKNEPNALETLFQLLFNAANACVVCVFQFFSSFSHLHRFPFCRLDTSEFHLMGKMNF